MPVAHALLRDAPPQLLTAFVDSTIAYAMQAGQRQFTGCSVSLGLSTRLFRALVQALVGQKGRATDK